MKRIQIVIGGVFAIILLAILGHNFWLPAIAKWLIISDQVVPADVIVVSTGSFDRIYYAMQLWKQGLAPKILVLSPAWHVPGIGKHIGELTVDEMISQGIPHNAIFTDFRPGSTYEDAIYTKEWTVKAGVTSLIVLEDPFGMRRLQWTFRKVFAGTGIQVYCVAVPLEMSKLRVEKWWTRENELLYVFEEYIKLIMYWMKY